MHVPADPPPVRACYWIVPSGGQWMVITAAQWPDSLHQHFATCEQGIEMARIVASMEWERYRRPTQVCTRDAGTGKAHVEAVFG